ncbi:IS4 family transposase [Candidatus Parcubacteria bacterium]|nr:IS4 family transposase [Candidatus Parcubacteria bacterium]
MHQGKYVFAQIIDFIPRREFNQFVKKYQGDKKIRSLNCRDQLLSMMFGQLGNLKSLSGMTLCLNAHQKQLYHLGFKTNKIVLSTLTRANENRDWRICRDFTNLLIDKTRKLYINDNDFKIDLDGTPYAIDSTIIEMCLSLFKWANFEKGHSAIKIHTQLDLRGNIPSFFLITEAKIHDVNLLDVLEYEEGAYYIMDRGYYDFARLYKIHKQKLFFIIRAKKSISWKRLYSKKVDKATGLRCDQIIKLNNFYSKKHYPDKLRRVKYYDDKTNKCYVYLTNNFNLDAIVIADLYKHRWQIELFFKWIKQHLHINTFWGTSKNAVKTQICIAISAFLLVAIMKMKMNINRSIYEILQILSVSLFEKTPINTLLSEFDLQNFEDHAQKRLFSLDF